MKSRSVLTLMAVGAGVAGWAAWSGHGRLAASEPRPTPSTPKTPMAPDVSQASTSARAAETRVSQRREAQFERLRKVARAQGSVRVIVEMAVPNYESLATASRLAKGPGQIALTDGRLSAAIAPARQAELAKLAGTPHTVNRTFSTIPFVALTVSEQALAVLERSPGVVSITEDHLAAPSLDNTVNITGASAAWTEGLDGTGWYVAILDTGIRASHNFFAGKNIVQACFALGEEGTPGAGDCPNGLSSDTTSPNAAQHHATSPNSTHGTHVAGIATGNDPGRVPPLYGIARGADIIAVQVFSQFFGHPACGGGDCVLSYSSDQMGGLDFVFSLRSTHNIASANMSLGGGFYDNQAVCDADNVGVKAAIDNLRGAGIATVIASGNEAFCDGISGPGCISSAVAVGATDDSDFEAGFSNFHPTLLDIYAPGVNILSSVDNSDSSYDPTFSGTSMATPHVAGAWAIMKQTDPGADVATILSALQTTGVSVTGGCVGTPTQRRIQINRAIGTERIKFSQPPDGTGEAIASNIDWTDMDPNVVVADDFVSDGRPINSVRWWGSNIPPPDPNVCDTPFTCGVAELTPCGTPPPPGGVGCGCFKRPDGTGFCAEDLSCAIAVPCPTGDADCLNGLKCSIDNCCGGPVCLATCPPAAVGALDNGWLETGVFSPWAATSNEPSPAGAENANAPWTRELDRDTLHAGDSLSGVVAVERAHRADSRSSLMAGGRVIENASASASQTTKEVRSLRYRQPDWSVTEPVITPEPVTRTFPPPNGSTGVGVVNGDFETGTLAGWTVTSSTGNGKWVTNDGSYSFASGSRFAPCAGGFSAATDMTFSGTYTLYQDVAIPAAASVVLTWTDLYINHDGAYADPAQEFRVVIRNPTDNADLATVYSTNPGDPTSTSCTKRCADISAFAGSTVRIAFEDQDDNFYFNVQVDDVAVTAGESCPPVPLCPAGETCAVATSVPFLPFNAGGNTCACANDYDETCSGPGSPDAVYAYTPAADESVSISLCNGSAYDTTLIVYTNDCSVGASYACNDDSCGVQSRILCLSLIGGNTYYIVVDGYGGDCGDYVLDITPNAPPICGNGAIDCGEQCDPPNGVTCNDLCRNIVCGDGVVEGAEQCDPPDGLFCDSNCRTIFNPPIDGWLVSFHEPLTVGGAPARPLGLYFCDANVVAVRATSRGSCDARSVREYKVNLADCCLVHANVDSRSEQIPAQPDAFREQAEFAYDIDIQAVVGHKYVPAVDPQACDPPHVCSTYVPGECGDPSLSCVCATRPDGSGACHQGISCPGTGLCPNGDIDCTTPGTKCFVGTCCGDPICAYNCGESPLAAQTTDEGTLTSTGILHAGAVPSIPTAVVQAGPEGNVPGGTLEVRYIGDPLPSQGRNVADTVAAFPSAASTVIGEIGFIDATQIGYFWSVARGDSVTESFATGETAIGRAIFDFVVPSTLLNSGAFVDWDILINGLVIGSFTVVEGQVGPVHLDFSFAPLAGPNYTVRFQVTNEVPGGAGSHTLGYAGAAAGTVRLLSDTSGHCVEVATGNTTASPFWGWQTTGVESGLRSALQSRVSMSGPDWLYGPWANLLPTCSRPNMAFQLLTETSGSSPCPDGAVRFVNPPDGVVDAGQPYPIDDASALQGIHSFVVDAPTGASAACWTLCETASTGSGNAIVSVVEGPLGTYTIALARPITRGAVTTLTYVSSTGASTTGRFIAHPGNATADSHSDAADAPALAAYLNGAPSPFGAYSEDIDRSGMPTASDLIRLCDVLNGAGDYDPWLGTPAPVNTVCP